MSIADNIKRLRIEHGLSQAEFGKIAGVSDKAVSTWESGVKTPRMGAIEKIAAHFGILKSTILDDIPLPTNAIPVGPGPQIPVLGSVRCGQPMYAEGNIDGYVPYLGNSGEVYFALRAVGDSMNAAGINDGDLVIVRQQDSVDPNTIAVICVNGDEATLKRFRQEGNTVFLMPQSTNPEHQVQVYDITRIPVHIIGRVMEIRKQL